MSAQSTKLNNKLSNYLCCLLLTGSVSVAHALDADVEKPVEIEADTAIFDRNAGTASYDGAVIIKQGSLEILATHVDIVAPDNEIQHIIATGSPVNFKQEMDNGKQAMGEAREMQYFIKEKRLTLQGDAELQQDKDILTGHFMEYLTDTGELKVNGKGGKSGRVSAVFYPTNKAAPQPDATEKDKK
ncbi:MAG: lipopolysaccharide transport periplasmic protein LptA [Gammaproteobacteria bacterium]|nr:lipopolysaccharide transport periplasmic protein LptA [Gammaproteobacteria bacterium]MBU1722758.1 lipopolysaccharide transport periplasmic protein LptA [Gammaproteobacteria bacterium]MBU2005215.1 lipopolysaccharide transport periplasmic protein LptA [Gammaproteobacteria bacterium]